MRSISLFMPGNFEDAYVYMGRLLVLTAERSLRFYDFERMIGDVEDRLPELQPMFTYLFTRNDWLTSSQFKSLLENKTLSKAFLSLVNRVAGDSFIEFSNIPKYLQFEFEIKIPARIFLDMTIYNRRMYFGTESGFYHLDAEMGDGSTNIKGMPVKRHDGRSLSALAGYGSIHVSCGNDGLFSAFDEFSWFSNEGIRPFRQVAERSLRTAWSGQDIINYLNMTTPVLLTGVHEKTASEGFETDRTVLLDIVPQKMSLEPLLQKMSDVEKEDSERIQYVFNSNNTFFMFSASGQLQTVGIGKREDELSIRYSRTYRTKRSDVRVLSMHPTNLGLVLETDDQILIFANGEIFSLLDTEVLSVRTFIRSRRYKSLVVMTREDGVIVTGLFQEDRNLQNE